MGEKITKGGVPNFRRNGVGHLQDLVTKHNKPTAFGPFDHAEQVQEKFLPRSVGTTKSRQLSALKCRREIFDRPVPGRACAGTKASNVLATKGAHGTFRTLTPERIGINTQKVANSPPPCRWMCRALRRGDIRRSIGGNLPRVFNPNAAGASVFADHHATAVKEIRHGGDRFTTVAGAGSHDGDQFAEGVFCAVDFFVDIFHGSFYLLCLTAWIMPAFKRKFARPEKGVPTPRRSPFFQPRRLKTAERRL
jgi:hypothetical protein